MYFKGNCSYSNWKLYIRRLYSINIFRGGVFTSKHVSFLSWPLSFRPLQAQVPMAIPRCVTLSGCRGRLLRCSIYFLYGDIDLFRSIMQRTNKWVLFLCLPLIWTDCTKPILCFTFGTHISFDKQMSWEKIGYVCLVKVSQIKDSQRHPCVGYNLAFL